MITLFHIYYNQRQMLPIHLKEWRRHRGDIRYAFIDDGSQDAIDHFPHPGCHVYRIHEDIPWNIAGARNLGFHVAQTPWVLMADVDHVVTAEALKRIVQLDLTNPNVAYTFRRRTLEGKVGCKAIINLLMNRERFFEVGGFDEDFSGHYGNEEDFFKRCLKHRGVRVKHCRQITLEWYPRKGATAKLSRDRSINRPIYLGKKLQLQDGAYKNGSVLRFSWSLAFKATCDGAQ